MDAIPRHSSPRPAPPRAARRVVVPRRAGYRPYRATARALHRRAAIRGSATATRGGPRSRHAWESHARHQRRDRAGRGTAHRPRSGLARAVPRRRGTLAAVVVPLVPQRWSSWPNLDGSYRSWRLPRSNLAGLTGRANQGLIGRIDRIAVLGTREATAPHVPCIVAEGGFDRGADFGVPLHEPGRDVADEIAKHVVRNDELPIHVRPCADAIDEHAPPDALPHKRRRLGGDGLEQNFEYTPPLQRPRIAGHPLRGGPRFSLDPTAAQLPPGFGREGKVAPNPEAGIGHPP